MNQEQYIAVTDVEAFAPEIDLSQFSVTTISGMLTQASDNVRRYCNVDGFWQTSVTSERDRAHINAEGDLIISFRRPPVNETDLQAIRLVTVGVNQSLTLTNQGYEVYFIPAPGNYVVYPSNYLISFGRGLLALRGANLFYEVDYLGGYVPAATPGYTLLPSVVQEATLLFLRDILAKRYNQFGMDMVSQGSFRMQTRRTNALTMFVDQARDLLDHSNLIRYAP
jgi:hypothetical protein